MDSSSSSSVPSVAGPSNQAQTPSPAGQPPQVPARLRPTKASSSGTSIAGHFLISKVRHRVATPPALPLPLDKKENTACRLLLQRFGMDEIGGLVRSIANDSGLENDRIVDITVTSRPPKWYCTPLDPRSATVLIVADWDGCGDIDGATPTLWENVVCAVKQGLDELVWHAEPDLRRSVSIGVEMISHELDRPKYILPIEPSPGTEVQDDWDRMQKMIIAILWYTPETRDKMVNKPYLVEMGTCDPYKDDAFYNDDERPYLGPCRDTILITLDYESDETVWPAVERRIRSSVLQAFGYDFFDVRIEHGEFWGTSKLDYYLPCGLID
ncbi:hypothetical protein QBC47DRAFT_398586 [Echria macrotheca]|uniref:Uncharacterized protein n=1 Tax=Echria macrotheca TaxID=438768 RepID=A0AAJ0BMH8_9PEZI|nr:hypothetical protein QBC47DRAFT_398586 [Echria macrotheca]